MLTFVHTVLPDPEQRALSRLWKIVHAETRELSWRQHAKGLRQEA
jgi:hypothetical protein